MKDLLVINSSARVTRSITRHLTGRFTKGWKARQPGAEIIVRDVGLKPPPAIDESWIAAAFSDAARQTPGQLAALQESETLIGELFRAGAVVMGVPMYNFGMPAQLKSYIDQIVRVGRTFAFDQNADNPYIPLIPSKPVVIITSTGAGGYEPGSPFSHLNFLDPHLEAVLRFVGLADISFVRVGFEEFQDQRVKHAISVAETSVDRLVGCLTAKLATGEDSTSRLQIVE